MRGRYVLDAGVLALYFAGYEEAKRYIDLAYSGEKVYMCEVNVAEFLYNYARVFGWDAALVKHALIRNSPLVVKEIDETLTVEAARLKLKYYDKLSLADCYLIALAKQLKSSVVTTDSRVKEVMEAPTRLIRM
ncbi:DNA-binding protein [Candidatus Bathyarchaeota archaeon]|nr:MAG: DNA-binding protein [Candidatus Bathyarchaeota archaeon]